VIELPTQIVGQLVLPRSLKDPKNHEGHLIDKIKLRATLGLRAFVADIMTFCLRFINSFTAYQREKLHNKPQAEKKF
jgi:hypothetical protein